MHAIKIQQTAVNGVQQQTKFLTVKFLKIKVDYTS
jgi:hypothetical protein